MALRDEIEELRPPPSKLENLLEEYGAELQDLLEDRSYSAEAIMRLLKRRGHAISSWPIKNWRRTHGVTGYRG